MSARIYRCNRCAHEYIINDIDDDYKTPKACPKPDCGGVMKHIHTVGTSI